MDYGNFISTTNPVQKEEGREREKWTNNAEFVLSCLGYCIGLGNVWRFPYMCGQYGGAAFMIPYFILLLLAGLPIFYMELALGQYASLSPANLFKRMCPLFEGFGYTCVCIQSIRAIYYNMVMAYCLYYLSTSFSSMLPWTDCTNAWNDCRCSAVQNYTQIVMNSSCDLWSKEQLNNATVTKLPVETPAQQYFNLKVLGKSAGIENIGTLRWDLVVALLVAWILVFFCLIKGIRTSGKVVYFTATFPYLTLLLLVMRGVTLDGAVQGLTFFAKPNLSHLLQPTVWTAAAGQVLFSFGLGEGSWITLASYNEFHNNFFRGLLVVAFGNCMASILAGLAVFSVVGFLAKQTARSVDEIASQGPSLVFITYPEAVKMLPIPQFWAVLFFFTLVLVAIDSMMVTVEVVRSAIIDRYPSLRDSMKQVVVIAAICCTFFLCGLVMCTPAGLYIISICDKYAGGWVLILSALVEICMVSWIYGLRRFVHDVKFMLGLTNNQFYKILGFPVNLYWIVCWAAVTPVLLVSILIFIWVDHERKVDGEYIYPYEADIAGWLLTMFCIGWIPVLAIYHISKTKIQGMRLANLIKPTEDWGPYDLKTQSQSPVTPNKWRQNEVMCPTNDQSSCSNPVAALPQLQPSITCRRCNMLTPHYAYDNDLVKQSTRM